MTSRPLNIAYVFDGNFTAGEGVPNYVETLGSYFSGQGHSVSFLVGKSDSLDQRVHSLGRTISVHFNGNRVDVPLLVSKAHVNQLLNSVKPDILHIQMPYSPILAGHFIQQAAPDVGIVATFHIFPKSKLTTVGSRLLSLVTGASRRKLDYLASVSASAQSFAKSAFHIESEIIPCPIDLERFAEGRKLAEYDDGKINILFLGRLVERKGCQYLLDAINALEEPSKIRIRVLIAGKGPLLAQLQDQTVKSGLDQIVRFLGFIKETDKPNLFASADIAVFPSIGGESFGIVLIEAMASNAGVVIGGDNTGYRDVLNKDSSVLFDPKDVTRLSEKLSYLISNKQARDKIHVSQQQLVKNCDISVIGPRWLDIYESVLSRKNSI